MWLKHSAIFIEGMLLFVTWMQNDSDSCESEVIYMKKIMSKLQRWGSKMVLQLPPFYKHTLSPLLFKLQIKWSNSAILNYRDDQATNSEELCGL